MYPHAVIYLLVLSMYMCSVVRCSAVAWVNDGPCAGSCHSRRAVHVAQSLVWAPHSRIHAQGIVCKSRPPQLGVSTTLG